MATTSMNIRMDSDIKRDAQEIFSALGMDMTTAVNIFLRQAIRQRGLPFEVKLDSPNAETLEAIEEIRSMKQSGNKKVYSSFSHLVEEVQADV